MRALQLRTKQPIGCIIYLSATMFFQDLSSDLSEEDILASGPLLDSSSPLGSLLGDLEIRASAASQQACDAPVRLPSMSLSETALQQGMESLFAVTPPDVSSQSRADDGPNLLFEPAERQWDYPGVRRILKKSPAVPPQPIVWSPGLGPVFAPASLSTIPSELSSHLSGTCPPSASEMRSVQQPPLYVPGAATSSASVFAHNPYAGAHDLIAGTPESVFQHSPPSPFMIHVDEGVNDYVPSACSSVYSSRSPLVSPDTLFTSSPSWILGIDNIKPRTLPSPQHSRCVSASVLRNYGSKVSYRTRKLPLSEELPKLYESLGCTLKHVATKAYPEMVRGLLVRVLLLLEQHGLYIYGEAPRGLDPKRLVSNFENSTPDTARDNLFVPTLEQPSWVLAFVTPLLVLSGLKAGCDCRGFMETCTFVRYLCFKFTQDYTFSCELLATTWDPVSRALSQPDLALAACSFKTAKKLLTVVPLGMELVQKVVALRTRSRNYGYSCMAEFRLRRTQLLEVVAQRCIAECDQHLLAGDCFQKCINELNVCVTGETSGPTREFIRKMVNSLVRQFRTSQGTCFTRPQTSCPNDCLNGCPLSSGAFSECKASASPPMPGSPGLDQCINDLFAEPLETSRTVIHHDISAETDNSQLRACREPSQRRHRRHLATALANIRNKVRHAKTRMFHLAPAGYESLHQGACDESASASNVPIENGIPRSFNSESPLLPCVEEP